MLDLTKLAEQLPDMGSHLREQATAGQDRLDRGFALLRQAQQNADMLK